MEIGEILECSLDEIALEGLEGINIPGLWIRVEQRISESSGKLDDSSKEFLWKCVVAHDQIECFEVSTSPDPIDTLPRYRLRDPELGLEIGLPKQTKTNELTAVVNDKDNNIRGLCANYEHRKNLTSELRSEDYTLSKALEKWGDKLVLVASQYLRNRALLSNEADPEIELNDLHYVILEKLGKSRYLGQLQTEICSSLNIDSKNMFYQRKKLFAKSYVTSQNYAIRLASGRLQNSVLLLLKRFHVDYRSKYETLAEKLSNILSAQPDKTATFVTVKQEMGLDDDSQTFKKMLKHVIGLNLVKTYSTRREVFKGKQGKKMESVWHMKLQKSYAAMKDETGDEEDEDEDESTDTLPTVPRVHELPLLNQVYNLVEQHGSDGIPLTKIRKMLNLGRLELRQLGKNLLRSGTVQQIPHDEGRQRTYRYVSVKHIEGSQLKKDLEKEKIRSIQLQKTTEKVAGVSGIQEVISGDLEQGASSVATTPSMTPAGSPVQSAHPSRAGTPEPADDVERKKEIVAKENDSVIPGHSGKMLTARVLKRRNIIIETVRTCKVVRGVFSLLKAVLNAEREEGLSYRCDKKSIIRLVKALVKEGLMNQFTTMVETDDGSARTKVEFITDVNIKPNDELVKSATLQIKFHMENVLKQKQEKMERLKKALKARQISADSKSAKISSIKAKKLGKKGKVEKKGKGLKDKPKLRIGKMKKRKSSEEVDESDDVSSGCENDDHVKLERIKNTTGAIGVEARKYGYLPKMPRLKVIHQYIWYLVYGYKGKIIETEEVIDPKDQKAAGEGNTTENKEGVSSDAVKGSGGVKTGDSKFPEGMSGQENSQQSLEKKGNNKDVAKEEKKSLEAKETDEDESQGGKEKIFVSDTERHPQTDSARQPDIHQFKQDTTNMKAKVYVDEEDWRRFLPPLPKYNDCGKGWCLVSDLLLWMPLSIFCNIVQLSYKVDNLEEYLDHPRKRHTLLGHLPRNMRIQLLHRRKYVFTFDENLRRLSSMGLVIYGPQKSDTKDQVFIYVCQHSMVVDTAPCLPHYNRAMGGPFKKKSYQFHTEKQLEQYWFDLQCICLSTPLGVVRKARKKTANDTEPETSSAGGALANTIKDLVISVDDISRPPLQDNGTIPGDGQGAGGMDSSFYAHLKRNWHWIVPKIDKHPRSATTFGSSLSATPSSKAMRDVLMEGVASTSGELTPDALIQLVSEPRKRTVKAVSEPGKKRKKAVASGKALFRKKPKIAKLSKRTRGPKDATDVKALAKMTKQRVGWTAQEDSLLLLCKVASTLLSKKKKEFVPWSVVRDILHESYECSKDKTSAAVNRRSKYILNNPQTALNLKICLAEVYQDKELLLDIAEIKGDYDNPEVCATEYKDLVEKTREKFSSLPGGASFAIPDTLDELYKRYKVVPIGITSEASDAISLKSRDDIIKAQLMNLIQITLAMDSSEYNSHQVFKVYEKYPSEQLEAAFNELRNKGLVNRKRPVEGCKTTRHVPFAAMSYQLSVKYHRYFLSLTPVTLFQETNNFFQELLKGSSDKSNQWLKFPTQATGGTVCCIATLMSMNKLAMDVVVPDQVVVVDSELLESQVVAGGKQSASNTTSAGASDDSDGVVSNSDISELITLTRASARTSAAKSSLKATYVSSATNSDTPAAQLSKTATVSKISDPQPSTSKDYEPPTNTSDPQPSTSKDYEPPTNTSDPQPSTSKDYEPPTNTSDPQPSTSKDYEPPTNTSGRETPSNVSSLPNITFDVTPRQASRSNLLLYRGQYAPGIVTQRNLNPQDNIVVNSCTVSTAIATSESDNKARIRFEKDQSCLEDLQSSGDVGDILQLPTSRKLVDYCKDTMVKTEATTLDDVIKQVKGHKDEEALTVALKIVYGLIEEKKEFGVPVSDLTMWQQNMAFQKM
ncbi:general transcription factor 3C polypeptide 1-like isoform X2 [Ptychodera flava]|uniref:general transcription factor 3C polypeptide 1-like isoform X2 n=1 Tax=Ptychodera flava TaxID=63121 RepID=UPI00396A0476